MARNAASSSLFRSASAVSTMKARYSSNSEPSYNRAQSPSSNFETNSASRCAAWPRFSDHPASLRQADPEDDDRLLALCDLGLGYPELGYVSLAELSSVRGRLGLPVERDLHFVADKPLSAYAEEARKQGRIIA